jgi:hypothetical protein
MLINLYAAKNIDLINSALLQFFILSEPCNGYNFNSILFFINTIDCTIYFTIDTRTDNLIECIILDIFNHLFFKYVIGFFFDGLFYYYINYFFIAILVGMSYFF